MGVVYAQAVAPDSFGAYSKCDGKAPKGLRERLRLSKLPARRALSLCMENGLQRSEAGGRWTSWNHCSHPFARVRGT